MPLERQNFDQADFALLEETALRALLHPDIGERRKSALTLGEMRIVYNSPYEEYAVRPERFVSQHPRKFNIIYNVYKVETHEGLVVAVLRGRKLPESKLGICNLPERYIEPVNPKVVIPLLVS